MKKVKCYYAIEDLEVGKIYNVINENKEHYFLDNGNSYRKVYFKENEFIEAFAEFNESLQKDNINPTHYQTKIQPIEFIEANNLGFHEGNVIKYITRYKDKNGIEDLEKAKTYIEMLINKLKREQK